MKYLVFPEGYDPAVANGLPTAADAEAGDSWTQEDVDNMRQLEKQAVVQETEPSVDDDVWYHVINE